MSKHTKGPWHWGCDGYGDGAWLFSGEGPVLDYAGCGSHACSVSAEDARLIAAAPDLLEALREAWPYVPDHHGPVQASIKAALFKATGEQQ